MAWADRYANRGQPWHADELEQIKAMISAGTTFPAMAAKLGRSQEAIRTKARKMASAEALVTVRDGR